jgi:hypothetical protein
MLREPKPGAEQRLRRSGAEADQDSGRDDLDFGLEPRIAGLSLSPARLLVNAALAARDPFEMLHGVGEVRVRPCDVRCPERLVEQPTGWTDERSASSVFLITGLLADQHHQRVRRTFAENRLRAALVEIASGAPGGQ